MNQITTEVVNRLIWVEVLDSDGRIGWIPATYLTIITPTSTKTLMVALTSTGIPTNTTFVSPDNGSNFEGAEYGRDADRLIAVARKPTGSAG